MTLVQNIRQARAYWIKEADYPSVVAIFEDGNMMPRTWSEWLKTAGTLSNVSLLTQIHFRGGVPIMAQRLVVRRVRCSSLMR